MTSTPCLSWNKHWPALCLAILLSTLLSACAGKPVGRQASDPSSGLLQKARHSSIDGEYTHALQLYQRAYLQAHALDDADAQLQALLGATGIHLLLDAPVAAEAGRRALKRLEQRDGLTPALLRQSRFVRARVLADSGRLEDAEILLAPLSRGEDLLAESARLLSCRLRLERGDSTCLEEEPTVPLNRARWLRLTADVSDDAHLASNLRQQALDLYRRHRHRPGIAQTLEEMGDDAAIGWQIDQACVAWLRSLHVRIGLHQTPAALRLLDPNHLQRCPWPDAAPTLEKLRAEIAAQQWTPTKTLLLQFEQALNAAPDIR